MLNKNLQKSAYSLIYALVITTIIMIVATTAVQGTLGKLTYYNDVISGVYAKYSAESAIDNALLLIKDAEAGYEIGVTSTASGNSTSAYTVVSRAQHNNGSSEFYTPIPMTGTAAPSDECDYLSSTDEDVDHACNWNKILYGQSVTIPLYSYDPDDIDLNKISNPDELGLTSWNLKVRTPCEADADGVVSYAEDCGGSDRYSLEEGSDFTEDKSIVLWQLVGEDIFTAVPDDQLTYRGPTPTGRSSTLNTEIYSSLINGATNYSVLTTSSPIDTTIGLNTYDNLLDLCKDSTIEKLYLQLTIVNPLIDDDNPTDSVPYLEWQLESSINSGFADNKAVVIGKGYYVGQSGTFYYPSVVTRTTVGERTSTYTISN